MFWHDVGGEFSNLVHDMSLEGVNLVRIDEQSKLQLKIQIETGVGQRWLLYSNLPEPEPAKDWLLDVRLRSKAFNADRISMLLENLGLTSMALKSHLLMRTKFFRLKDREDKLKRFLLPNDNAQDIDRKMLSVITRADLPELFAILQRIYAAFISNDTVDLNAQPKVWLDIGNNELESAFWELVKEQFGYAEAKPSLRDLLFRILVTDFASHIVGNVPKQLAHFVLPERAFAANASVFVSRWRSDVNQFKSYNALAQVISHELNLQSVLSPLTAEQLLDCMTFEEVELKIIHELKKSIIGGGGADMESVRSIIARRQSGHWANPIMVNTTERTKAMVACYDALIAAADFFNLKAKHTVGFSFIDASKAFYAYREELFRFDQLYRHFHSAADLVEPMGWALLHELREKIENIYSGWFIPQLSSAWSKVVEGPKGLLEQWTIPEVTAQQNFFNQKVQSLFEGNVKRVFVVISDAFRYEVADELVQLTNTKNRFKASLDCMLGVLPSYTALGMAALLPHQTLSYKDGNSAEVLVDGQATATLDQRNERLKAFGGLAIKFEDLMAHGKDKGRELVRDYRLIYIYHDRIDMIGDKQASETKTFEAADQTVKELSNLITHIVNGLNGSTVLVTADHGFMYQESALEESDKSVLEEKPEGTLVSKKRYLLGQNIGVTPKAWCGNTSITAGTTKEGSLDFWVPKGASRFHLSGGARFVHGSAMPQEIMVPLITVRVSESEEAKVQNVGIQLIGSTNKVVTNRQRFEFIQTEAVSERVLARKVVISILDGATLISDEKAITFNSTSQLMDERKQSVFLTIRTGTYDLHKRFDLVVRDAVTKVEVLRQQLQIDLAFGNDF